MGWYTEVLGLRLLPRAVGADVTVRMLTVTLASSVVTFGVCELLIRWVAPLQALSGIKGLPSMPVMQPQEATPASGAGTAHLLEAIPGQVHAEQRLR